MMSASLPGCSSVARLICECDESLDRMRQLESNAREGAKQLGEEIMASVAARSGLWQPPETSGEVLVNAGNAVHGEGEKAKTQWRSSLSMSLVCCVCVRWIRLPSEPPRPADALHAPAIHLCPADALL